MVKESFFGVLSVIRGREVERKREFEGDAETVQGRTLVRVSGSNGGSDRSEAMAYKHGLSLRGIWGGNVRVFSPEWPVRREIINA